MEYDIISVPGDILVGQDLLNAAGGEKYDRRMALVEAALLGVPIRGLPTSLSTALRMTLGAARFGKLLRRNATVAEALKGAEWTKPVMTARAQRRAARAARAPRG